MVCADHVGGGWSNLVEGVELSLTPPPAGNNWYAVPLQQPVREQLRRHKFSGKDGKVTVTQLSFSCQLT